MPYLVGMTRLLAAALVLLTACDHQRDLEHDTAQPLTESTDGTTPTHGYWALRAWPTLVLSEDGSCPVEAVDKALEPFLAAGIAIRHEVGVCNPEHWNVEDGRVCLEVDDEGLQERHVAGNAWWRYRTRSESVVEDGVRFTRVRNTDQITVGGIRVKSSCNPMVIAHEVGHILGLGHSEDPGETMWPSESDVLAFSGADLASIVARHAAR